MMIYSSAAELAACLSDRGVTTMMLSAIARIIIININILVDDVNVLDNLHFRRVDVDRETTRTIETMVW